MKKLLTVVLLFLASCDANDMLTCKNACYPKAMKSFDEKKVCLCDDTVSAITPSVNPTFCEICSKTCEGRVVSCESSWMQNKGICTCVGNK